MKSALLVWGGWSGHQPEKCINLFPTFLKEHGYEIEISDSLDVYTDRDKMLSLDLIVQCWTMGTITTEQERGLLDAVASGVGMAGWHGGMCDSFRNNVDYQFMTGGQWVAHPGGLLDYDVHITKPDDPIVSGMPDFRMTRTEQYYMHVDPSVEVLATTTFDGGHGFPETRGCVMPVAWKKKYVNGKVFYTSLGHVLRDFKVPEVLEIVKHGMLWASRNSTLKDLTGAGRGVFGTQEEADKFLRNERDSWD